MADNTFLYIDTDKELEKYTQSLKEKGVLCIALDIEGEFNLHHYGEHLCLVQVFDREKCVIIDPKTVSMSLLKLFFENTEILKIMYDCSTDRTLLYRKYSISINSIMDLYPAVDLLDYDRKGLSAVLDRHFSYENKSKNKFQKYNWMKRPIEQEALEYAADDVVYLFDLKEKLINEIIRENLLDAYFLKNLDVQNRPVVLNPVPGVLKKGRYKKLPLESKKIFNQLHKRREIYAEELDLPPNSVVSNDDLFSIASFRKNYRDIVFSRKIGRNISERILSDFSNIFA